jgi:ABC-type taurine transport system substrate-binding protein
MNFAQEIPNTNSNFGIAAAMEAKRLAEKYGKDYLNCDDLVSIMGIGKNNVRQLLNSHSFPTVEIGNRKVVSVLAFAVWSLQNTDKYI